MQLEENRRTAKNYQQKLEDLFRAVDDDGNGWLSPDEFVQALSLPSVQRYLVFLDLKVSDCRPLFDILDDGDGKILGCPEMPLFPFLGALGSPINPFKQKRAPFLILGYWAT